MKRLSSEKFARAFASVQQDLLATEGLQVRHFRATRSLNRQAPEATKQERHRADSNQFHQQGASP